jgi:hypothetical protein
LNFKHAFSSKEFISNIFNTIEKPKLVRKITNYFYKNNTSKFFCNNLRKFTIWFKKIENILFKIDDEIHEKTLEILLWYLLQYFKIDYEKNKYILYFHHMSDRDFEKLRTAEEIIYLTIKKIALYNAINEKYKQNIAENNQEDFTLFEITNISSEFISELTEADRYINEENTNELYNFVNNYSTMTDVEFERGLQCLKKANPKAYSKDSVVSQFILTLYLYQFIEKKDFDYIFKK